MKTLCAFFLSLVCFQLFGAATTVLNQYETVAFVTVTGDDATTLYDKLKPDAKLNIVSGFHIKHVVAQNLFSIVCRQKNSPEKNTMCTVIVEDSPHTVFRDNLLFVKFRLKGERAKSMQQHFVTQACYGECRYHIPFSFETERDNLLIEATDDLFVIYGYNQ